jgi:phosphoglucomutase
MADAGNDRARVHRLAGQPVPVERLVDVPRLVSAYFAHAPDAADASQRVQFGTSGHRGSAFAGSFNERHVLAISQAICDYRRHAGIDGPLFLGIDTHALSVPASMSAIEVLAANGISTMLAVGDEYTPTPAVSHAILCFNRGRSGGFADGIIATPSHNPPEDGGFKYNPPNGGPAGSEITTWIERRANDLLVTDLRDLQRMPYERALRASNTHRHDYLDSYARDLGNVLDMEVIRDAKVRMGVDPLGGAGVRYWPRIAEQYGLDLTIVSGDVDPTFRFMTLDWDGRIRMDPSSAHAMQRLVALKDRFDVAFACDPDYDRHGIVTPDAALMPPNHYLAVAADYLFQHRPQWSADAAVGKTLVSSRMIDLVAAHLGRRLFEVPVGFKWFVEGLLDGSLGFACEESAGAAFLRHSGLVWTTDKDGIILGLLAAEIKARTGRDPGAIYSDLARTHGEPLYERIDAPASPAQKERLKKLSAQQVRSTELAGDPIEHILTEAPGNGASIGGLKVATSTGWFAARPSGTEDIYKIYAESFTSATHLERILAEAQQIVGDALAGT